VLSYVSRPLMDADDHLHLTGGLCDRWRVSDDLRTFTFHLRKEAVWEDGTPVTAHDAAVTMRLIADLRVPALRFATGLVSFVLARELDAKTVQVVFSEPYAMRLSAFRFGLLPAARYEGRDVLRAPENRAPLSLSSRSADGGLLITAREERTTRGRSYASTIRIPLIEVVFPVENAGSSDSLVPRTHMQMPKVAEALGRETQVRARLSRRQANVESQLLELYSASLQHWQSRP